MKHQFTVPTVLACLYLAAAPANAADFVFDGAVPSNRVVLDCAPKGSKVYVFWTGKNGQTLGATPTKTVGDSGCVTFKAPKYAGPVGSSGEVTDFRQIVEFPPEKPDEPVPKPGPASEIEVFSFEPISEGFLVHPFTTYIDDILGPQATLSIPDFYGDTNGDGQIGTGDWLYSAVNLVDFFAGGGLGANLQLGDTISVTNGVSALLPGFIFGTSPFIRDANAPTGIINPTPYSGNAQYLSRHDIAPIPLPPAPVFFATGLAMLFVRRSRSG